MPRLLCLLALLISSLVAPFDAWAGDDTFGVRIAKFKANREAAISYTLDDGWEDAATLGAPMLDRHGIKATFFLVPGRIPDVDNHDAKDDYGRVSWTSWKKVAQAGHEMASHTLTHPALAKVDDATLEKEVNTAYDLLLEKFGTAAVSFAYPFNGRDARIRKVVYAKHAVAREFETGYGGPAFTTAKANGIADAALMQGKWIVPMIHAIEKGYAAFTSASVLEEHFKYVATLKDRIWIDTFGNIARYVKARDAAKLEVAKIENGVTFTLTTPTLDPKLFNVPLTVLVEIKTGAASAVVKRGDDALPITLTPDGIRVEVEPGPIPVTVTWRAK